MKKDLPDGTHKTCSTERHLTGKQAATVVALLDARKLVPAESVLPVAEELIRRLPDQNYDVFARMVFEDMPVTAIETALGLTGKAVRARYKNALRQLNSPATLKLIHAFKKRNHRAPITKGHLEEIAYQRERTGTGPSGFFEPPYEPPEGLTVHHVLNWMRGSAASAPKEHLDYMLAAWRALPDVARRATQKAPKQPKRTGEDGAQGDRVALTEDDIAELRGLRDESGTSPRAMLGWAAEHGIPPPPDITEAIIAGWVSRGVKTARADHLAFTRAAWSRILEAGPRWIPLNAQQLEALRHWRSEGLLPGGIFERAEAIPEGLDRLIVGRWLTIRPARVREDHLNWVLKRCDELAASPDRRVRVDAATRERLTMLRERTGIGPERLLSEARDIPPGLTENKISFLLSGRTETARYAHVTWLLNAWRQYQHHEMITLTQGDVQRIADLLTASGMGPQAALRRYRGRIPEGVGSNAIKSWLSGNVRVVRRDHFEFVVAALQSLLSSGLERIVLTGDHIAALEAERSRTGIAIVDLVRQLDGLPGAPTANVISGWFSGLTRSALKAEYDLVLRQWRSLPNLHKLDASILGVAGYRTQRGRIVLSDAIVRRLRALKERTGMSGTALIRQAERSEIDIPAGFAHTTVMPWLDGSVKTAKPEHLEFAIRVWESSPVEEAGWVEVSGANLAKLDGYREDGFIPSPIFQGEKAIPEGLSAAMVGRWLSGQATKARKDHWDWVLARCAALSMSDARRVPITPEVRGKLEAERERTGVGQTELLRGARDVPEGLKAAMISQWINGYAASARMDYLDYVIERWEGLPGRGD